MRLCSAQEFVANPIGGYVMGPTWLYFADEVTAGCLLWGRPSPDDARALLQFVKLWLAPGVRPRASFFDMRHVEVVTAVPLFPVVSSFIIEHHAVLAERVTHFSVVVAEGYPLLLTKGFWSVVKAPYPVKVFTQPEDALRWVEHPRALALADQLAQLGADARQASPIMRRLHAALGDSLREATIASAARELGLSTRTLQRRLRDERTTFEREIGEARVRAAQAMMLDSAASLTSIAYDVGCASPAHFSVVFRRVTGETPTEWRARRVKPG